MVCKQKYPVLETDVFQIFKSFLLKKKLAKARQLRFPPKIFCHLKPQYDWQ